MEITINILLPLLLWLTLLCFPFLHCSVNTHLSLDLLVVIQPLPDTRPPHAAGRHEESLSYLLLNLKLSSLLFVEEDWNTIRDFPSLYFCSFLLISFFLSQTFIPTLLLPVPLRHLSSYFIHDVFWSVTAWTQAKSYYSLPRHGAAHGEVIPFPQTSS